MGKGEEPQNCEKPCVCDLNEFDTRFIVLTGGPGAGKTAVLESAKKCYVNTSLLSLKRLFT